MILLLSNSTIVVHFQKALEHNQVTIPSFSAKLISHLAYLRRSNGDEFHCRNPDFHDFKTFIDYCYKTEKFILTLDLISMFPTLGSRFKDNNFLYEKVKIFFSKIYLTSDFSEVTCLFINELNWIVRANPRNIPCVPASKLYE